MLRPVSVVNHVEFLVRPLSAYQEVVVIENVFSSDAFLINFWVVNESTLFPFIFVSQKVDSLDVALVVLRFTEHEQIEIKPLFILLHFLGEVGSEIDESFDLRNLIFQRLVSIPETGQPELSVSSVVHL